MSWKLASSSRIAYHIICIVILFLVRRFGMFSFVIQWEIYSYLTWQSASPELYLKLNCWTLSYAPVTSFFSSTTFCWRICFLTSLTLFPTILLCSVISDHFFTSMYILCIYYFHSKFLPDIITWALIQCYRKFVVAQSLIPFQLFSTPWTAACQASQYFTISWSLLKLMSIELVMPSYHLILCCPLLLLPSIFPSTGSFLMKRIKKRERERLRIRLLNTLEIKCTFSWLFIPSFQKSQR